MRVVSLLRENRSIILLIFKELHASRRSCRIVRREGRDTASRLAGVRLTNSTFAQSPRWRYDARPNVSAYQMMMQFRRSGQRDDRRRRVLTDTLIGSACSARAPRGHRRGEAVDRPPHKSANYGDAVFMDEQPRLTDLIPLRLPMFLIPLIAGIAVIAALEALYAWMPRLSGLTTDGHVAAFDLDGEGSLAVWFSSMTLSAAGVVAILVYLVRRHRVDDYQGHYRVWLWAAMCWFLMSLDETASLHEGFKEMMSLLAGTRLFGDGSIWWVVPYFFLLGAVGTRLLMDMRSCWLSSTVFVMTAACYLCGIGAQLGWIMPESGARGVMVEEGAEMLGNLLLLLTMGLHARHVILDARGLLPQRCDEPLEAEPSTSLAVADEADEAEAGEEEPEPKTGPTIAVHPPHGTPRPAAMGRTEARQPAATVVPSRAKAQVAPPAGDDEACGTVSESIPPSRKLTKEERRALRKRQEKSRKHAERHYG